MYQFFQKNPKAREFVRDRASLSAIPKGLADFAITYPEQQEEADDQAVGFKAEAREMRKVADFFEGGVTVDFALSVGLERGTTGKYHVGSLTPVAGAAKKLGAGVRLAFYELPEETIRRAAQRGLATQAAERWLEEPKLSPEAMVYCR